MLRTNLVVFLAVVGCAADPVNGDDDGGSGTRPPMTNGVSTLAGWSNAGFLDGNRQVNLFSNPTNVAYGPDNKLYVADFDNSKLRVVDMDGNATTIIATTSFKRPFGLAFVGNTLYVSTDNDGQGQHDALDSTGQMSGTVWRVDLSAKTATVVIEKIGRPRGLCALSDGRLGIADYAHHVIELLDPKTGSISTIAGTWNAAGSADGTGAAATFNQPYACAQSGAGKLVVTDAGNSKLRLVGLDGVVTTIGGGNGFADGSMSGAKFNYPQGLAKASSGDLYLTDVLNFRVRKISSDLANVTTIAGDGTGGFKDDDDRLLSELYGQEGIAVKPDGSLVFVADGNRGEAMPYNRIRLIKM